MINELRRTCRQLLEDGTVQVVIGYGQVAAGDRVFPVFITKPEDVDQLVWNDHCFANLTKYLTRKEMQALGKAAICVKGCDERAIVVLEKESQIDRSQLVVIGLACDGVGDPRLPKCESCDVHVPQLRQCGYRPIVDHVPRSEQAVHPLATPIRPLCRTRRIPEKNARGAAGLLDRGAEPLRQVLCLPAGVSDVLLPAVHRR